MDLFTPSYLTVFPGFVQKGVAIKSMVMLKQKIKLKAIMWELK